MPPVRADVLALDELDGLSTTGTLETTVGAKAAALGRARRRGLPVLPGFVVPARTGRALVASVLDSSPTAGPHAVALAVMEAARRVDLTLAELAAHQLGACLVVRSSSAVEADPLWSGAFSSFLDVAPGELPTAVAGCWASTVMPAVLDRCGRTGTRPEDVCPAVLVQPMVEPEAGGIARMTLVPDGTESGRAVVEVVGVRGSPAPLLAGWSPAEPLPPEWVRAAEDLVRRAGDGLPATVEWAVVDGAVVLLQVRQDPKPARHPLVAGGRPKARVRARARGLLDRGAASPVAPALSRALARYGGPLGDELVLPWVLASLAADGGRTAGRVATGAGGHEAAGCGSEQDLVAGFDRTVEAARVLVARATAPTGTTGTTGTTAAGHGAPAVAVRLLERLAVGDLGVLESLHAVPAGDRARVLSGFEACGRALRAAGVLAHEEQLWALSAAEVRARLARPDAAGWHGHRFRSVRWQPLVQASVAQWGRAFEGEPAAAGRAAGWGRRLATGSDLRTVVPGDVVVVERPFPQAAPSLWVASAVVAESGSPAAHLVEVARSLRVPAVVGAGPVPTGPGALVLVDGDAGAVHVLDP